MKLKNSNHKESADGPGRNRDGAGRLQFVTFDSWSARRACNKVEAPPAAAIRSSSFRVHMNTLETPCSCCLMWIAANTGRRSGAAIGAIYRGAPVYLRAYVANPNSRSAGYGLSFMPAAILAIAALAGAVRSVGGSASGLIRSATPARRLRWCHSVAPG
jgi:hypothetical protein